MSTLDEWKAEAEKTISVPETEDPNLVAPQLYFKKDAARILHLIDLVRKKDGALEMNRKFLTALSDDKTRRIHAIFPSFDCAYGNTLKALALTNNPGIDEDPALLAMAEEAKDEPETDFF